MAKGLKFSAPFRDNRHAVCEGSEISSEAQYRRVLNEVIDSYEGFAMQKYVNKTMSAQFSTLISNFPTIHITVPLLSCPLTRRLTL